MSKEKWGLNFTRGIRAERPSYDQIETDSATITAGGQPSQDPTKDCFFTFEGSLALNASRLLTTAAWNPYANKPGEGVRFVRYPHGGGTGNVRQESMQMRDVDIEGNEGDWYTVYAKISLQTTTETGGSSSDYEGENNLTEALAAIDALEPSDGWVLILQHFNGRSEVMKSFPSLWISEDGIDSGIPEDEKAASTKNLLGRQDADRY